MTTHLITIEVPLQGAIALHQAIEAALREQGEPLRWAVTSIDTAQQIAHIEAIVTCE